VTRDGLLIPGNPALGVVRHHGRYMVFASERAVSEFMANPQYYARGMRVACRGVVWHCVASCGVTRHRADVHAGGEGGAWCSAAEGEAVWCATPHP
jgi:hypothetical protein